MKQLFRKGDLLWGFLRRVRNKRGEVVVRPAWGRVGTVALSLAIAGWLSAAFAVLLFVRYTRGFQGGNYWHIVFPWKWDSYHLAWGEEFVERGLLLLEEGKLRESFQHLRVGHIKSPANLRARLALAEFYIAWNRPDIASQLLAGGLAYAPEDDLEYLRTTFRMLLANQEDLRIKELAASILPETPELTARYQLIALASATAYFYRGNYDEAEQLILDYGLTDNREGRILLSRIEWDRGEREQAIQRLEELADQFVEHDEIYVLLSRFYRELGDDARAHGFAVKRQIANPMSAVPRIGLLYSFHANGDQQRIEHEASRLIADFFHDASAMFDLAEFAANTGNPDLARRVMQTMDRAGLPIHGAAMLLGEAYLNARQYRLAIDFLEEHGGNHPEFAENFGPLLDGIYAVAHFGLGNTPPGEMHLSRFLGARHLRSESFIIIARRLMERERIELARRVIQHAYNIEQNNQAALAELVRIDLLLGRTHDLLPNLQRLLGMRTPPRSIIEESYAHLGGDRYLFLPQRVEVLNSLRQVLARQRGGTLAAARS